VLEAWLALVALLGIAGAEHHGRPAKPGEEDFWVKLGSIRVRDGRLKPSFDPDITSYEAWVNSSKAEQQTLFVSLDVTKYDPLALPVILIDGKKVEYAPLEDLRVDVWLNETVGPFDRTTEITVKDPQGTSGFWVWTTSRETTYRVRVRQPPIFEEIVRARNISVFLPNGTEVPSQPEFDPHSEQSRYTFHAPEEADQVTVKVDCSQYATGLHWDEGGEGTERVIDLKSSGGFRQVLPRCVFDDPNWVKGVQQRSYALTLSQDRAKELEDTKVRLMMLPDQGYCEGSSEGESGFVCRSAGAKPRVMVLVDREQVKTAVIAPDGASLKLVPQLPQEVPLTRPWSSLRMKAGHSFKDIPVRFLQTALCDSLQCPSNTVNKRSDPDHVLVCRSEACSGEDVPHCCAHAVITKGMKVMVDEKDVATVVDGPDEEDHFEVTYENGKGSDNVAKERLSPVPGTGTKTNQLTIALNEVGVQATINKDGSYDVIFEDGSRAFELSPNQAEALLEAMSLDHGRKVVVEFCRRPGVIHGKPKQDMEFGGPTYHVVFDDDGSTSGPLPRAQLSSHKATCHSFHFQCPKHQERRSQSKELHCHGYRCVQADEAVCCRIKEGTKVEVAGRVGSVRKGPDENMAYDVQFDNSTAATSLTAAELEIIRLPVPEVFRQGDLVRVYGTDGVVKSGPDEDGMYKVVFSDDGETSYPLPPLAMVRRRWRFKEGDQVDVHGRLGEVVGHGSAGKYKVKITEPGEDGEEDSEVVAEVPPSWLKDALAVRGPYRGKFAKGEEVFVDDRYPGLIVGGPDSHERYRVAWPGGQAPKHLREVHDEKHQDTLAVSSIDASRLIKGGFTPGMEVLVHGRAAIIIQGPDDYRRYIVNFEDDSSTSRPVKEKYLTLKSHPEVVLVDYVESTPHAESHRWLLGRHMLHFSMAAGCITSVAGAALVWMAFVCLRPLVGSRRRRGMTPQMGSGLWRRIDVDEQRGAQEVQHRPPPSRWRQASSRVCTLQHGEELRSLRSQLAAEL